MVLPSALTSIESAAAISARLRRSRRSSVNLGSGHIRAGNLVEMISGLVRAVLRPHDEDFGLSAPKPVEAQDLAVVGRHRDGAVSFAVDCEGTHAPDCHGAGSEVKILPSGRVPRIVRAR